jgi:sn-glycerol 3-phosphate transport system permease protein
VITKREKLLNGWPRALLGFAISLLFIFPFYWMLVTALKPNGDTMTFPPEFIPWPPSLTSFQEAWTRVPMLRFALNSVITTGGVLILQLPLISMAAYAFSHFEFKGKKAFFTLCLMAMMIPAQVTFLPNFLTMKQLNWLDTYWALIVPFATSAYGIFMLRQAFMQVPKDLINAAQLDGASHVQIIFHVLVPIAKPVITTVALFSFIGMWNSYFWPLVATNSDSVRTLPVAIAMLRDGDSRQSWGTLMAGNMTIVMPVLAIFLMFQKNLVRSFVQGAMK